MPHGKIVMVARPLQPCINMVIACIVSSYVLFAFMDHNCMYDVYMTVRIIVDSRVNSTIYGIIFRTITNRLRLNEYWGGWMPLIQILNKQSLNGPHGIMPINYMAPPLV